MIWPDLILNCFTWWQYHRSLLKDLWIYSLKFTFIHSLKFYGFIIVILDLLLYKVYLGISHLFFQDTFFYSLVYDPSVKTLLADKGEIRVGPRYQADIPEMLLEGMFFFGFQVLWKHKLYLENQILFSSYERNNF